MLKQTSKEFRKLFLLEFTRQLIDAYAPEDIAKLERILKKENKEGTIIQQESRELVKSIVHEKEKELKFLEGKRAPLKQRGPNLKQSLYSLKRMRPVLRIPETRLPQTFQYLKPTPTNTEIDLGKLNPLIKDPLVREIQCSGINQNIIVKGNMGTKPTSIILNKSEIDLIIQKFSNISRIPVSSGIYKVIVGKLILSAIISEVIGSRFIINKMIYNPKLMPRK